MNQTQRLSWLVSALCGAILSAPATAQNPTTELAPFSLEELRFATASRSFESLEETDLKRQWAGFRAEFPRARQPVIFFDPLTQRPLLVELPGIPFIPGSANDLANDLQNEAILGGSNDQAKLQLLESRARQFIEGSRHLLNVASDELILARDLSGRRQGRGDLERWALVFRWAPHGVEVAHASMTFQIAGGNLVQFGMQNIGDADEVPRIALESGDKVRSAIESHLGRSFELALGASVLRVFPVSGAGYLSYRLAWATSFADPSGHPWASAVDAESGELLFLRSEGSSATCAVGQNQATGGVRSYSASGVPQELIKPLPFVDYGVQVFADSDGCYPVISDTFSNMTGLYFTSKSVDCSDNCIRRIPGDGVLDFGSGLPGTQDCNSTGDPATGQNCVGVTDGGLGNTTAMRSIYYYAHLARQQAVDHYPCPATGSCWQSERIFLRSNDDGPACNAFYNNSNILTFGKSSVECRNYGEIPSIVYHEYGHWVDNRADGSSSQVEGTDGGSREAYSDIFSTLLTRDSCYGRHGDHSGSVACGAPFGYDCMSCDGVRELNFRQRTKSTNAPRTPARNCSICPVDNNYFGPCGRQAHCESHVASEAFWDLATVDLPASGLSSEQAWQLATELWFRATPDLKSLFLCGGCPSSGAGAAIGTLYAGLRAADDCDGDLTNGTPNAPAIFNALARHGIAAGNASDPSNQANSCGDLAVDLYPSRDGLGMIARIENLGTTVEPSAQLTVSYQSPALLDLVFGLPLQGCVLQSIAQTILGINATFECSAVSLPPGESLQFPWGIENALEVPEFSVRVEVSGSLPDNDPSNNSAEITISF